MIDSYDLRARVFPAVLSLVPLLVGAGKAGIDIASWEVGTLLVLVGGAIAFALAQLVSSAGRKIEQELFADMGGSPSVQVLRHRDNRLNAATKVRYHAVLSKQTNVAAPDSGNELADVAAADEKFTIYSDWLRSNTRDSARFPVVLARNAEYGFLRNGYAARRLALAMSIAVSVAALVLGSLAHDLQWWFVAASSIGWVLAYRTVFSIEKVREAAFRYAIALVEATDSIA